MGISSDFVLFYSVVHIRTYSSDTLITNAVLEMLITWTL